MNPRNYQNNFSKAQQFQKSGEIKQAIACYNLCNPTWGVHTQLAHCHIALDTQEDLKEAIRHLEIALGIVNDPRVKTNLLQDLCKACSVYFKNTGDQTYLDLFMHYLEMFPHKNTAEYIYWLAVHNLNSNNIQELISCINEIKEKYSCNSYLTNRLKELEAFIDRKIDHNKITKRQAEEFLAQANNATTPNIRLLLKVVDTFPELIDRNNIHIIRSKDIKGRILEASFYQKLNLVSRADEIFSGIIDELPNHWEARRQYASFLIGQECYEEAIDLLLPLIETNESINKPTKRDYLMAYRALAIAYSSINEKSKAWHYVKKGLELDPNDAVLLSKKGKLQRAQSKSSINNFEAARIADKPRFETLHKIPKPIASKVTVEDYESTSSEQKTGAMLAEKNEKLVNKKILIDGTLAKQNESHSPNEISPRQSPRKLSPRKHSATASNDSNTRTLEDISYYESQLEFVISSENASETKSIDVPNEQTVTPPVTPRKHKKRNSQRQNVNTAIPQQAKKKTSGKPVNATKQQHEPEQTHAIVADVHASLSYRTKGNQAAACSKFGIFATTLIFATAATLIIGNTLVK